MGTSQRAPEQRNDRKKKSKTRLQLNYIGQIYIL